MVVVDAVDAFISFQQQQQHHAQKEEIKEETQVCYQLNIYVLRAIHLRRRGDDDDDDESKDIK